MKAPVASSNTMPLGSIILRLEPGIEAPPSVTTCTAPFVASTRKMPPNPRRRLPASGSVTMSSLNVTVDGSRSEANASSHPLVSSATRFEACDSNVMTEPSALIAGALLELLASVPDDDTLTRVVSTASGAS